MCSNKKKNSSSSCCEQTKEENFPRRLLYDMPCHAKYKIKVNRIIWLYVAYIEIYTLCIIIMALRKLRGETYMYILIMLLKQGKILYLASWCV